MNEQINLLELDNDKLWQFYGHYCNDDWSAKTE
ncbi:MAG: PcfU, partial [Enterococcus faecalis]|nr:PcfU [Enterococcus faecalis]